MEPCSVLDVACDTPPLLRLYRIFTAGGAPSLNTPLFTACYHLLPPSLYIFLLLDCCLLVYLLALQAAQAKLGETGSKLDQSKVVP